MSRANLYWIAVAVLALATVGRAEFCVNTHVSRDQIQPTVAMNDDGDFAVIWRSHVRDGRGGGVYGRCFEAEGSPSSDEFQINDSAVDVGDWAPAVAVSPEGTVVVSWVSDCDGGSCIAARTFDLAGNPLTDTWIVSASSAMTQSTPSIAMNASGSFVIVWTNWDGDLYLGRNYVAGRLYDADGVAVGDVFEVTDRAQAVWPDVAMDDEGNFVVTWLRMGDVYNRPLGEYVMLRQYAPDGTPCGEAIALTANLKSRWYTPSVAASLDGQFVVSWAVGPFPYDIYAQSFDAACGTKGSLSLINTAVDGNQGHPHVTTNGAGDYLIVWDSHDPDGGACVCGQVFTQDCALAGGQMQFNTPTGRLNWYPDTAMTQDGRYVVVWIGQTGDSDSGYDVFAEIGAI